MAYDEAQARTSRGAAAGLVLASAIGLSTGMTATMFYSMGVFIPALAADMHWQRGETSLAVTLMTVGLFAAGPLVGRLCDRHGAAAVGAASLLGYAALVIVMALSVATIGAFQLFYVAIAILGAGSTPIALVRPIATGFVRRRGLALGCALTGAGLAGFWVPVFTQAIIASHGWRAAYCALAATAIVAAPVVWLGFRGAARVPSAAVAAPPGLSAVEARRTARYWLLSVAAVAMALGVAGLVVHLVPLFRDLGADPGTAARTASIVGLASVVGRLVVGLLLDRFAPALVSAAILALSAAGAALLWAAGLAFAPLAAALLGLAAGAELDLLAFLTARYFGRRAYGAIYGWHYGVFALGYGLSPYVVGRMRDALGDYDAALGGSVAMMACAALAMLALSRRDGAGERFARAQAEAARQDTK